MKKKVLSLLLSSIALVSLRADIVFTDGFNYADGPITNNAPGIWYKHSGTAVPSDSLVHSKKIEVSATGGTPVSRQDDVHCLFPGPYTNSQTVVYASFTVNCTNLPPAVGAYFAHFYVNSSTFHARVFAQAPTGVLPGTWRLGIAGAAGTVNKVFPIDLATNTDYQVVVQWDPVSSFAATLWVNPIGSTDLNVVTGDAVSAPAASIGYAFRQASSFGNFFCNVSNLVVATTFDEATTNVWSTNAVSPIILRSPTSKTNFVGDVVSLIGMASGQGLAGITYQWQKNGANVTNPNGNTNAFSIASAAIADTGNYAMIATTPYGLSATSALASLWVTNAPIPPTITPTNNSTVSVFYHQSTTLSVVASGPPPLSYAWYYNNAPATGGNLSDDGNGNLTISDVFTNNDTTGAYYAVATNPYGNKTSGVFTVTAIGPPAVSVAYLRTLVDPVNFIATNSTLRWQATGTVTTFTNLTTGDTSSYYLQDGTAGINIFVTHGTPIRFNQGDVVTFIGWLSSFNSTLELEGDTNDLTTSFSVVGTNSALPAPMVIPFSITNDLAFSEYKLEGRTVMLTNVYFGTNAGVVLSTTANTTAIVTNAGGETFSLLFSSQDLDTAGQTLPAFAYSVIGVFNQNLGNGVSPRNAGYQVEVTRFADIVTDAPPAVNLSISKSGNAATLSWQNVGWDNVNRSYGSNYSYTVLAATDVAGPYAPVSNYQAAMRGVNEVPPNPSSGIGAGSVVLSPDQTSITVNMSFTGLTAPATAAHIHGPAGAGTNAAVLFPFTGVPNATSGSIPQQTFSITPTQLGYLQNGLLYMNVHDGTYPGGELRAQLVLAPSVGLTFANTSLTNTDPTTATFTDPGATSDQKFYRVVSP